MRPKSYAVGCWLLGGLVVLWQAPANGNGPPKAGPVAHSCLEHRLPPVVEAELAITCDTELTLEPELQAAAERLLARATPIEGSILVVDVASGRLLTWAEARHGTRPGYSVALNAEVPAASLFKLVTTTALFERGGVQPQQEVCIQGGEHGITRRHLEAPKNTAATCGPFLHAVGFSRNAVFAQLATERLTHQDLVATAARLGFNSPLPFDAPATVGQADIPFNDLEFARTAAGFGKTTLTPLGALHLALVVARGGQALRMRVTEPAETEDDTAQPPEQVMRPNTAWRLTRMMEVTIHSGTSLRAFTDEAGKPYLPAISVAGKTGTLQREPSGPTSSWFVGFAPSRRPRVAVGVLLQNRPVWRQKANTVARDVLRAYFAARGAKGVSPPFGG